MLAAEDAARRAQHARQVRQGEIVHRTRWLGQS
jgi:hypothetical protein